MTLLSISLFFLFSLRNINYAHAVSDPGYRPSSTFGTTDFQQVFKNFWGPKHQDLDGSVLSLSLDKDYGGSGFKSQEKFQSGYVGADIKLSPIQYTAGVDLSSMDDCSGPHDEVDIEFLGHTKDNPYVLQTNVFIENHSGKHNTIGREMKFHLWFDPTLDYHNYAIYWDRNQIIFFVDDVPIRRYPQDTDTGVEVPFPQGPVSVYGSIWDASTWATDNGQSKIDYNYQPFLANYTNFMIRDCDLNHCQVFPDNSSMLSNEQQLAMESVQQDPEIMIYNYCDYDKNEDTPEC